MKVRYLIKYAKNSDIKFISHLDLMRTIQRTIRRAEIPVEFSKGFNPHMSLSIGQPLAVGVYSEGDYLDLVLLEEVPEEEIIKKLNENAPSGITFLEAVAVPRIEGQKKLPQAMAAIEAASYTIKFVCSNTNNVEEKFSQLLKNEKWEILKKSKSGEKLVNIKPQIKEIKYWLKDEQFILQVLVSCGSKENLSPQLLSEYIINNTDFMDKDKFVDIKRKEMYIIKNKKYVSLADYFRESK